MSFELIRIVQKKWILCLATNQRARQTGIFPAKALLTSHLDAISVSKNLELSRVEGHLHAAHPPVPSLSLLVLGRANVS